MNWLKEQFHDYPKRTAWILISATVVVLVACTISFLSQVWSTVNPLGASTNILGQNATNAASKLPNDSTTSVPNDVKEPSANAANSPAQSPTATENVTAKQPEPAKDTLEPILLDKPAAQPSDTAVTIAWKTDEKATSQVRYGTDTSYLFPSIEISKTDTSHSVYITGLTPDTTYHFQVISSDESGNTLSSGDYTFRTESVTNAAPYAGSTAPNFTLKTLDGTEVSLSQFRGKKVILNFWASWCTPCKVELPHLQATWDKYKDSGNVMLLTVAGSQSDEDAIRSYVKDKDYNFTVCLDSGDSTFNRYEIVTIPKTYFIDKGGTIKRLQQGMFTSPGEVEFMLNSY
ncbi:MAG: redoxin domain-containing protein [Chloroflexi bacterium]|nr:redoxin domain-containing protein [Chloroflexota bacterium]